VQDNILRFAKHGISINAMGLGRLDKISLKKFEKVLDFTLQATV